MFINQTSLGRSKNRDVKLKQWAGCRDQTTISGGWEGSYTSIALPHSLSPHSTTLRSTPGLTSPITKGGQSGHAAPPVLWVHIGKSTWVSSLGDDRGNLRGLTTGDQTAMEKLKVWSWAHGTKTCTNSIQLKISK